MSGRTRTATCEVRSAILGNYTKGTTSCWRMLKHFASIFFLSSWTFEIPLNLSQS